MSTATIALRTRPRPLLGPALGPTRLPVGKIFFSAVLHALVLGALWVLAAIGHDTPSKPYVVNLVPAIAAVGSPQGRTSAPPPPLPPRPTEVTQPPVKTTPKELPPREVTRPVEKPTRELVQRPAPPREVPPREIPRDLPREAPRDIPPSPPRDLPQREATRRELPQREARASLPQREARATPPPLEMPAKTSARENATLPDRMLPTRAPTMPRPGDKELPPAAPPRASEEALPPKPVAPPRGDESLPPRASTAPRATSEPLPRAEPPAPPPAPLGQTAGSAQGVGSVTLNVSDFPYAWYIQAIHRKIQERWEGRAIEGRQPEVIFEIGGDGQLRRLLVGKTSGNVGYDQVALRAVGDASPFPPLPSGFGKSTLTVGLQFIYDPRAR